MAKLIKCGYARRAAFPKGEQKNFLESVRKKLGLSINETAKLLGIHPRSLRDWRREKFLMSLPAVIKLCKETNLSEPENIKIKDPFWYASVGAKKSGQLVYEKYGPLCNRNPELRKKMWLKWWERKGKYNNYFVTKKVNKPDKSSDLAEFVGIIIGDGGITKRQITVSLNPKTDKHYVLFVKNLIVRLFGVGPKLYFEKNVSVVDITVSRTELVRFCQSIGLAIGNKLKQGLDIPKWVMLDPKFQKACLRGVVDTDGCLFHEVHKVKNKIYSYPRLNITSGSPKLINSVFMILNNLGLSPVIRRNHTSVQLENLECIKKYFEIIGSSNTKHLDRFNGGVPKWS